MVKANHVRLWPTEPYLSIGYSCVGVDALVSEIATLLHAQSAE